MSKMELPNINSHPTIEHNTNNIEIEDGSEDQERLSPTLRIEEQEII